MMNPTRTSEKGEFQEMQHTCSCEIRRRTRISQRNQEKDEEPEQIVMSKNGCRISENGKVAEK